MSKERHLFESLVGGYPKNSDPTSQTVLLVQACFVSNGFMPVTLTATEGPGCLSLTSLEQSSEGTFGFHFFPNFKLKCVPLGHQLAVHATKDDEGLFSVTLPLSDPIDVDALVQLVMANVVAPLMGRKEESRQAEKKSLVISSSSNVIGSSLHRPQRHPTHPTFPGGELVGPNHPIFTGESDPDNPQFRFDPIGPGHIGEPDTDHFAPPSFGGPRPRPPLRGPQGNLGPGDMFM